MPSSLSMPETRATKKRYRRSKPLPDSILDHCTICIEEQLFSQAFAQLSSALAAGTSADDDDNDNDNDIAEALVPPPRILALAATLAIHPRLTTRSRSADASISADDALRYLRLVNSTVGPYGAQLSQAFVFSSGGVSSRGRRALSRRTREPEGHDSEGEETGPLRIRSSYADRDSVWSNAEDFWAVVGWALNCSVTSPLRWARWWSWLEFLLDVLEDDLEECAQTATSSVGAAEFKRNSVLAEYVSTVNSGRNSRRRCMRAIFANGEQTSLAEFPEIWRNETQPPKAKKEETGQKRRKLDLENGEFGDYFNDDSDQDSLRRSRSITANASAQRSRAASANRDEDEDSDQDEVDDGDDDDDDDEDSVIHVVSKRESAPGIEVFGMIQSIHLRQRLIALLVKLSVIDPRAFLDTEELFDLLTEFLRPLPLPVFQHFVLPTKPYLSPVHQANLNQMLLRPLLAGTAPHYMVDGLTQEVFEAHFASCAANYTGPVDNAKVGLLLEGLLRYLWRTGGLRSSEELRELVESGAHNRYEKAAFDGRRKKGVKALQDENAFAILEGTANRLMSMMDMV